MDRATPLRRLTAFAAVTGTVLAMLLAVPASAAPSDPEGGSKKLRDALASASRGHVEATAKLAASKKRQKILQAQAVQARADEKLLGATVAVVAAKSYRLGRISSVTMLLNSSSPDAFLERAVRLDEMAQIDGRALSRYQAAADTAIRAENGVALEIKRQAAEVKVLAAKKQQAEQALATVGGATSRGFINAGSPSARSAPRRSDGTWPDESCSVNDPTSSGCITPRLLNAYEQSRAAGFKRYTMCYSVRSSGEHPKGRACDFSAASGGFENVDASGGDRTYGDNLAAFLVKNADRLGVMYVIWYRQIWMPGTGWRSYSGSGGPAAVHTNHVHLSVL